MPITLEMKTHGQSTRGVLGTALLLLGILSALSRTPWLDSLEHLSLDGRFILRGSRPFPQEIAVVGIDEASLDALGRWPWPRDRHGAFLQLLRHASFRPAAVGYDILFEHSDAQSPASDQTLAQQASAFGKDLIFAYFFEKGSATSVEADSEGEKYLENFALPVSPEFPEKLESVDKVSLPYKGLLAANTLGFANNPIDRDGRTRRMRLLSRYKDRIYPSMTLLTALRFLGAELTDVELGKRSLRIKKSRKGPRVIPLTAEGDLLINYWGRFRGIPKFSFVEILREGQAWMEENRETEKLRSLKDKLVIVGATALGLEDRRVTPFHEYEPASSVQSQAVANIVEGKFLNRLPFPVSFLISLILGAAVIFLTLSQRALRALIFTFLLAFFYLLLAYLAFLLDYWLEIASPMVTLAVLFITMVSLRYFLTAEELKRTYAQLLHAEKMASLGTLSASLAHEYRNYFGTISMAAEACRSGSAPPGRLNECLQMITTAVQKAGQISQSLLTFARKNESLKKEARLEKTADEVLLILEKGLARQGVEIRKEFEDVGRVFYDEGQISQVLMNLIRNASDALKNRDGEKQIALRLKDLGGRVLLEIEDNGPGIPKRVLERLFEPFVTSKKAGEGTGLGLSVCHGIIQSHGGEIKVKTAQGKGTTWQIYLPHK